MGLFILRVLAALSQAHITARWRVVGERSVHGGRIAAIVSAVALPQRWRWFRFRKRRALPARCARPVDCASAAGAPNGLDSAGGLDKASRRMPCRKQTDNTLRPSRGDGRDHKGDWEGAIRALSIRDFVRRPKDQRFLGMMYLHTAGQADARAAWTRPVGRRVENRAGGCATRYHLAAALYSQSLENIDDDRAATTSARARSEARQHGSSPP